MAKQRVNFGVIGAGDSACRRAIPGLIRTRNCKLVAVAAADDAERLAKQWNAPAAYAKEKDLLDDPAVEAVYIASPTSQHLRHIQMAAEAGKHVLCENPAAMNLQQATEAVEACHGNMVFFQEGYADKFHGAHVKIKEFVDGGHLGKIVSLRGRLAGWSPPVAGNWRQDSRKGGGAIMALATPLLDLLQHFAGPIHRIAAIKGRLVHNYNRAEDAATLLLEFKSGAQATVDCFFCIPEAAGPSRLEIHGTHGTLLAEGTINSPKQGKLEGLFELQSPPADDDPATLSGRKCARIPFKTVDIHKAQFTYFADCILQGWPPAVNHGRNAVGVAAVTEAALQSHRFKKTITL